MTHYLKFDTQEQAIAALTEAGFAISEFGNHFNAVIDGRLAEGTLFQIPNTAAVDENGELIAGVNPYHDGWFSNLFDCEQCPVSLEPYRVPDPVTPYNVRA